MAIIEYGRKLSKRIWLGAMHKNIVQFNSLTVGRQPRIVGIISGLLTVPAFLATPKPDCDIVELRLDRIGVAQPEWIQAARDIEQKGCPVIATLRIPEEGGDWKGADEERRLHLLQALEQCACVDIELRSPLFPELAEYAARHNKALIVSHHDYEKTPPTEELCNVMVRATANDQCIVKVAVRVNDDSDIERLRALLTNPPVAAPLSIIGMGDLGTPTRIEFPELGSCLAYGHLDESTAPGQLSCRELAGRLGRVRGEK